MRNLRARIIKHVMNILSKENYDIESVRNEEVRRVVMERLPDYIPREINGIETAVDNVIEEYDLKIRKIFSGFNGEIMLRHKSGGVFPFSVTYNRLDGTLELGYYVFEDKEKGRTLSYYDIPRHEWGRPGFIFLMYKNDNERYLIVFSHMLGGQLFVSVFEPWKTHFTGLGWKEREEGEFVGSYFTKIEKATKGSVIAHAFYLDLCNFIPTPFDVVVEKVGNYYELRLAPPGTQRGWLAIESLVDVNGEMQMTKEKWMEFRSLARGKLTYEAL